MLFIDLVDLVIFGIGVFIGSVIVTGVDANTCDKCEKDSNIKIEKLKEYRFDYDDWED